MTLQPGATLGPYEIVSLLGAGGMGEVYLAREQSLGRRIALKVLPADLTRDSARVHRFQQEARAASGLNHPNVCTIHALGETGEGQHYIAMEHIEGETLRRRLARSRLTLLEALDTGIQVAAGLRIAHAADIVHRDIKPENIMLRPDGVVKVLDFGLAKLAPVALGGADTTRMGVNTEAGTVVGTAAYMSPEQARGQQVDARTDIWSLGVMLYEMTAGRSPFAGPSGSDVVAAILQNEPAPVARFAPEAPAEVQRILTKTLRKDRSQRYQTVQDLLLDLQALREDLQSYARAGRAPGTALTTEPAASDSSQTVVPPRSRRHVLAVAAAVLVVGTVLGVWAWRTAHRAQTPAPPTSAAVQRNLTRLTFAPGLQTDVTFSPDGRFIAYASDQGGNFDIWVQPAAGGGDPVQVTKSPSADTAPDWSPDGGQIVFRSERDGGGLFLVSALGGSERRLASFGVRPKWSPDGSRILFASAPVGGAAGGVLLFTVGTDGLPPRQVLERFTADVTSLFGWAWHPDGQRVSMLATNPRQKGNALYTVVLDGTSVIITSLPALLMQGNNRVHEFSWAASGTAMYFELSVKLVSNLWRLDIHAGTLKATSLVQLTAGAGQDTRMAVSPDGRKIAFTTKAESIRIWSYRLDPVTGRVTGSADPLTDQTMAVPAHAALSPDGRQLAYAITGVGTGRWELWTTDLVTGQKHVLSRDNHDRFDPKWSRDGSRLVYFWGRSVEGLTGSGSPDTTVAVRQLPAGDETLLSTPSQQGGQPHDWSPDGNAILMSWWRPGQRTVIALWPLAAAPHADRAATVVAGEPNRNLWQGRFSPNGRWISFLAATPVTAVVCLVSSSARNAPASDWTCVTDPLIWTDKPRWSSDGKLLYVWQRQGSLYNVWALRFDDARGNVVGAPIQITQFDSPAHRIWADDLANAEPSIAGSRMSLPMAQATGSIWALDNVDK